MRFPILRLDTRKVKLNIDRMAARAKDSNLEFRPHFKTHQSHEIGSWFREIEVTAITVPSVAMAEYFSEDGWSDITIAFPVSVLDIDRINILSSKINLKLFMNQVETISIFSENLKSKLSVYIEIDLEYGRSGIRIADKESINKVLQTIKNSDLLSFEGFYAHAGHSYKRKGKDEVKSLSDPLLNKISNLKMEYGGKLCWGDTPSCSITQDFRDLDQLSPGNFVFFDWMQMQIGSCSKSEIAVTMECPVVSKFEDRNELLIHGGAVHFSKDYVLNNDGKQNFGQVINPQDLEDDSNYLKSISQEHGIVTCGDSFFQSIKVGDIISIYPIHSCLTANLMQCYITESGKRIEHFASGAPFIG